MEPFTPSLAAKVDEIAVRLETAFNAGDAAALASLYSDTAILMPPNEPMVRGSAGIRSWFEQALQRLSGVRIVPMDSTILGDQAFQVGTFTTRAKTANLSSWPEGRKAEQTGKYVLLLKRSGHHWKIEYDIWSLDQPTG